MYTHNPEEDAIEYINRQDVVDVDLEQCDVCEDFWEETVQALDKGGYCCLKCLKSGKARNFYTEHEPVEVVNEWIDNLKIK